MEPLVLEGRGFVRNHSRASLLVRPAPQVLGELVAMAMGTQPPVPCAGGLQMVALVLCG